MTYELIYAQRAIDDLNRAADWIAQHAPETAERWFNGFVEALSILRKQPGAFGVAPENEFVDAEIRQIIYRTKSRRANRALFTIDGQQVVILSIRRPGQDLLTAEELNSALCDDGS